MPAMPNCLHGIDARFCARCVERANPPTGGNASRGSRPRPARQRQSSFIRDWFSQDDRRRVFLSLDVEGAWRMHTKTACFFEHANIEWTGARAVVVTVSLFPRPRLDDPDWLPRLRDGRYLDQRAIFEDQED